MCFSKNYSLVEAIYISWLDAIKLSSFSETNNTDRNGVNKQNTHTKHPEKDNTGKGYLVWK